MKKKLSRSFDSNPATIGELIEALKKNFRKEDDIILTTLAVIPSENEINVEKNSAIYVLHNSNRTLESVAENRKQREIESLVMKKIK